LTKNPTQAVGAVMKSRSNSGHSQKNQPNKRIILTTSQTINQKVFKAEKQIENMLHTNTDHLLKIEKRPLSVEQMQRILGN